MQLLPLMDTAAWDIKPVYLNKAMEKDKEIKVSICCATYNHKPYLRQCLEGFLMQKTSFNYEILIHDDASTDGTTDIIREYTTAYPELIRPVIQTENQYSTNTRAIITSFLLPLARGKYIALCEGDDYWIDPLKLQKQADILDRKAEVSLCVHPAENLYAGGKKKTYIQYKQSQFARFKDIIRWKHPYWPTASFMYRKIWMINYPEFCKNCYIGDAPLMFYMALNGKIFYLNEVMSVYRKDIVGSHTSRFKLLDDFTRQQLMQSELNMLDGLNEWSNYIFNDYFIERKLHIQSDLLSRRRQFKVITSDGFKNDFRKATSKKQFVLFVKIYIIPLLRGNFLKTTQKQK